MITFTYLSNPFEMGSRTVETVRAREGLRCSDLAEEEGLTFQRNGCECGPDTEVYDGDYVFATRLPAAGGYLVAALISVAISAAVSYGIRLLMPTPDGPVEGDSNKSPTYGFSRIRNVRGEGQPIPVVYGEHRTAGTIVNEFVEVDNTTGKSTYFGLIAISEGPIDSIAGEAQDTEALQPLTGDTVPNKIFLNGNPLSNYSGVEAWVRLGTLEQDVVPGFERAKVTYDVNVFLTQKEGDPAIDAVADFNTADGDAVWDEFGFAWDAPEVVDGIEVVLNFPRGLYKIGISGETLPARFSIGFRFARLDENGNVLLGAGLGGNQNDGWVRLPFEAFTQERLGNFQLAFPISLFSPTDFTEASAGGAMYANQGSGWGAGTGYWYTAALGQADLPSEWWDDTFVSDYTFETWIKFDSGGPFDSGPGPNWLCMHTWGNDDEGVWYGFLLDSGNWYPAMIVGKSTTSEVWPFQNIEPDTWHHLVWTHKRISSSDNRNEFYLDGQLRGSFKENIDIITPGPPGQGANAPFQFGWSNGDIVPGGVDWYVHGLWDETKVIARAVSQSYVSQSYNGGKGQRGSALNNPDLVAAFHHDVDAFPDYGPFGNDGARDATVAFVDGGGIVSSTTEAARVRGRYRLQCMRINEQSQSGQTQARVEDEAEWQLAVSWLDDAFCYPGVALLGVSVPATEQLNTSAPEITAVVKGKIVKVWDGVSSSQPSFIEKWSSNPAWCCVDVATNTTYGGGHAFKLENVDWDSAQEFADRADTQVADGRGGREFYRQRWDEHTNWVHEPINLSSAASGGWWTEAAVSVVDDAEIAPDGTVTADTITDTSAGSRGNIGLAGTRIQLGRDPGWFAVSFFCKKDSTATTYSPSCMIQLDGKIQPPGTSIVTAIWNLDDGAAIQNCTVDDYSTDWWLVKIVPIFNSLDQATIQSGTNGQVTLRIYPSGNLHGSTLTDTSLQESMTVWGVMFSLGRAHLIYPTEVDVACRLFMGDKKEDGTAQVPPAHWVTGAELRITEANDSSWVTPLTSSRGLLLHDIEVTGPRDGYLRTWILSCSWYSEDAADVPVGTFPGLSTCGVDWNNLTWHYGSLLGASKTQVDDTAGSGSGADDPLDSLVVEIGTPLGGIEMLGGIATASGATLRVRAWMAVAAPVTTASIDIVDGGTTSVSHSLTPNFWESLEVDHVVGTNPDIQFNYTGVGELCWVDGFGSYYSIDENGRIPGGIIGGSEPLFSYDAVHDIFEDLWDAMISVCGTARATPMREGHKLRFKIEQPRSPVGLIGAGAIKTDGTQSTFLARWSDPSERDNSLTIDFWDRLLNWERSTVSRDDPDIETLSDAGLVRQQPFSMRGVTRRSQVTRNADYLIALNKLTIVEGDFITGAGALPFEPGDTVALANDIMPWGTSGRLAEPHSRGANLLTAAVSQDFSSWTYGTGDEVVVTPNVVASVSGDIRGDQVAVDSAGEEAMSATSSATAVNHVYSVRVKERAGAGVFGIRLSQSGGSTIIAEYTWATAAFAITSGPAWTLSNVTERNGWVRLGVEYQSANTNNILIEHLIERTAANYATAQIYLADAQMELDDGTDSFTAYDRPGAGLICDREVVLSGATGVSYDARITRADTGDSEICDILATAGTYAAGDIIDIDESQLSFFPQRHDEYIIYDEDKKFEGIVSSIDLDENLDMRVEFAQYDEAAFAGDADPAIDIFTSTGGGGELPGTNSRHDELIPDDPLFVDLVESVIPANSGLSEQWIEVHWAHDPASIKRIKETRVYVSKIEGKFHGALHLAGIAAGTTENLGARLPSQSYGRDIRVWVQPVSFSGTRKLAEDCASAVRRMSSYPTKPSPPTNFNAHMEGDQIVFTWEHPTLHEGLVYEVRHGGPSITGGWVLAQVVGQTSDNRLGPTSFWATAGNATVYYHIRAKNRNGVYSNVASILYGARVLNATVLDSSNHWYAYASQDWHSYADGWVTDSGAPAHDPVLFNLSRNSDGKLEFDSAKVVGSYKTASIVSGTTPDHFQREEWCYLEAVVIATCMNVRQVGGIDQLIADTGHVFPQTVRADKQIVWPFQGNVTAEGDLQGDLPRIRVRMKLIRGTTQSPLVSVDTDAAGDDGWIDYRPGAYPCHGAQFKLAVTRPTDAWNVRISEFSTQASRLPSDRHYRTPVERRLAQRIGLG